ncbi:MAG: isocitrate lyase/phosphoenolpyruvate mutase family protein [Candidatus Acidiferrales bacterium]
MSAQSEKADLLRRLHRGPEILVLPNAWDCASARIFEEAGFPAIATSSAGVAFSLGYPDEERISQDEMLAAVKRIAACVRVPVTADLESGYHDVTQTTAGLIDSGAVGLNLEDMEHGESNVLAETSRQMEKIASVRRTADGMGVKVVINARTDIYLAQIGDSATRFDRACERLRAYIEAGADCVFLPGLTDEHTIRGVVEALKFPVNILAMAGAPSVARLEDLGVARVSVGSGIMRATMGLTRRIAEELKREGTYSRMLDDQISYADANRLFENKTES